MSQSSPIVVKSAPQAIFRAMLQPASLSEWWGCTAVIDARAGGAWVGGWGEGPDGLGQQTIIWAVLAELIPDQRIVLEMGETRIAVDITPHAEGAAVTVSQSGYPSADPQEEAQALQSWVDMVRSLQGWVESKHPYVPPRPAAPVPQARAQQAQVQPQARQPASGAEAAAAAQAAPLSDPYGAAGALKEGGVRVLDDGGFGVTDPHAVIKSWSKEQGFGYVTHPQLGDVVFDYDGCDFEPAPGDKVLLLVLAKAWNGKPKVKRIACPAKGSKLDK